ncbi:ABC transporter ATP-binding protein [Marinobacterium sediminicola]|uniref:ABC-2 type transport system ATP-binding protein n=1 Tax=Marinobacterium sediminicola TaxID=518898 RepID=A0ABY1RXL2_9GAMM|nr:ABC transporter ATP-binding protein [Marinobacterium sediminicola]ULG67754.1 ATP-binding cassette domain-containing protein [Marinobacterium sediminicola]SMR71599.1 ABC-2 type transport system ATP-binding protein [Marinobacterium sediminicola]
MGIEVRNLCFRYGTRQALQDVSFRLVDGKLNALLGPNGAGKSTLYALLTQLFNLQQGEILLNGVPISRQSRKLKQQLGVVFQQSTLDLDLSVLQNLEYHGALHGLSSRDVRHQASALLERLELGDRLHDSIRSLNGGHRRRVEIARALLHRPSILLLDEATVGLDTAARQSINRHVRDLCRDQALTVLWATHLIEEIDSDDPVLVLHQGRLHADALAHEICHMQQTRTLAAAFEQITGLKESTQCA